MEMVESAYVNLQNSVFLLISPEMEFLSLIQFSFFLLCISVFINNTQVGFSGFKVPRK